MSAGVPPSVCTRLGLTASLSSTANAPDTPKPAARTGFPSLPVPMMIRSSRALRSSIPSARQKIAMISDAAVITKPSCRGTPPVRPPRPTMTLRSARSFMSMARGQVICVGSMPSEFGRYRWLSRTAESRACAELIAWKSPVKWRLISSMGTTWLWPPPAAPPLMPKTGPRLGSRRQSTGLRFRRFIASARPTETVDFPSPAAVGLMPVTSTRRPSSPPRSFATSRGIFALWWP